MTSWGERARDAVRWYWGLTLASILAGLLVATVVLLNNRATAAETARATTSARATRRIDQLNERITMLQAQAVDNGQVIAGLATDVQALSAQLQQAGKTPVVTPTTRPTTTTTVRRPTSSITTTSTTAAPVAPATTTTAVPVPAATTTTTRPCNVHIPNDGCAVP